MAAPSPQTRSHYLLWTGFVALFATLALVYYPALHGGFVWDDGAWTADLAHLTKDAKGLWRIWSEPTAMQQYYPVTGTSFWLDGMLWGTWTFPYHVENLVLHSLGVFLLWRLLRRLEIPGAELAAAIFALHPVMVESVAWVTERKNVLSSAFMIGGWLMYGKFAGWWRTETARGPGRPFFYLAALLLCALALGSKITAFVFAPTVLLISWWRTGRVRWKEDVIPTLPFFALTLAVGSLIWWLETYHVGAKGKDFSAPLAERLITAGRTFWFYPWKLLWPLDLCFIYPDWRTGATPAWWEWAWPASVVLFLAGLWTARGRIGRGPLAAVLFYLGALLPVIGILNVYGGLFAPVWDHWVYVPALSILVLVAATIATLTERTGKKWIQPVAALVILPLLALQAARQTPQYADIETLWIETIKRNPAAWLAHNNHGSALVTAGKYEEAITFFEASLKARPHYAEAWNNLGGALVHLGRYEESLTAYQKAISYDSDLAAYTRHNMGNALLSIGRTEEAMEQFRASLAMKPDYDEALNSLGAALTQLGRVDEALEQIQHAIRIKPDYHQAHNNLGSTLQKKGDLEGALAAYEKAASLSPKFVEPRFNIGEMLYKKSDIDGAIQRYQEVISIKPDHAKSHYNLGLCYNVQNKPQEAEAAYRKAIEIDPKYASAHNNLANILLSSGRVAEAVTHFQKAAETDASQLAALNNLAWVLATDSDASLRDGKKALGYARQASDLTQQSHPLVQSTLAAALAETGEFAEAARVVGQARELASKQGDANLAASFENQLRLYENNQPLRIQRSP